MKIFGFGGKQKTIEAKSNPTAEIYYMAVKGKDSQRNLKAFINEGYKRNAIVYRCIREITTALASVDIELHSHDGYVPWGKNSPLYNIINRPNPVQSWPEFLREAFSEYLISGNMFITDNGDTEQPVELWVQKSQYMTVQAGKQGVPYSYTFKAAGSERVFPVDQLSGFSRCFHLKTYNPDNSFIGLSPLEHIALACDTHNNGLEWNAALLKNGARPSGILSVPEGTSQEALAPLKEFFSRRVQGAENAGSIPFLTGGVEWKEMGQTAKDMDYIVTMATMAKYIASAYGVPLPLVDNDAASYNNIEQAKERLWSDTVLPLLDEFLMAFSRWLLPRFGADDQWLGYNEDNILALESIRARRYTRNAELVSKGVLTINEARMAIGYGEVEDTTANSILIPSGLTPIGYLDDTLTADPAPVAQQAIDGAIQDTTQGADKVSDVALDGDQVTALQGIVQAVADGMLPADSAAAMLRVAFPTLTDAQIDAVVRPAELFEPANTDQLMKALGFGDEEIKEIRSETL